MTQHEALMIMKMGQNVFLTGNAGSGKTYTLNQYITYLKEHQIPVAITASTGIAATHIGGVTIHAWSGLGIRETLSLYEIDQLEEKKYLWDRYQKTQVLIIDEVSMLSGVFLDTLNQVCMSMKRVYDKPFGGIQLILCGDLLQLPPVSGSHLISDSESWKNSKIVACYLNEQHRQHDDRFTQLLNKIRENDLSRDCIDILEDRLVEYDHLTHHDMTKLFTHNADVDQINNRSLGVLPGEVQTYTMTARGKSNLIENLIKGCLAVETLHLKEGAEVMFVKNNPDKGYVNGTRGIVTSFTSDKKPIVTTRDGEEVVVTEEVWSIDDEGKILASISQIPLRHAWAITVHKSQGMSLDEAVIDLSKAFTYGMGYVALSRVRSLDGLHLVGFTPESLQLDPRILAIDAQLQQRSDQAVLRLKTLSSDECSKKMNAFIRDTGGVIEPVAIEPETRKRGTFTGGQRTHEKSYELIESGKTLTEVAQERGLVVGTIIDHLHKSKEEGRDISFKHIKPSKEVYRLIKNAFHETMDKHTAYHEAKLTPVKRYLDKAGHDDIDFDTIKLVRLFLKD